MKKFFKWLLLTATALAIVIGILLYNPGLFKGPLENYLSKLTGYTISLAGALEISAGRKTALTITNLHIASPEWTGDGELVKVGYLNLVLDSASLFAKVVIIESLRIDDLVVRPATNAEGVGNWVITQSQPSQPGAATGEPAVIFKNIKLNNATVSYLNGETGTKQELHIVSLDQEQKDNGLLDINLNGTFNGRLVEYAGSIGPFANLVAGRDIAFTGNGHFGSLNISGEGLIDDLLEPGKPRFSIELQGPDIDEITAMLGVDDLGSGRFSLSARGGEVDGRYAAGLHGKIGDVSLRVSAQASSLRQMSVVDLELAAGGPSLGALTRAFGVANWPDKPFSLKGKARRVGTTLNVSGVTLSIGDTRFTLDALLTNYPSFDASRVRLSLKGDDIAQLWELLGISGIATGSFEMDGNLDVSADGTELVQLGLKTSLGQATLAGTLGPGPSYFGTKLQVNLDGQDAHLLLSAAGIDALPQQPFSLDARIELVEKGLLIERGALVTIDDDRLELGGLLALNASGQGSNFEFRLSGGNLSEMLGRLVGGLEVPGHPYALSGRVQLHEEGIELHKFKAEFEGIKLAANGLIVPGGQFAGTDFDLVVEGADLSLLKNFPSIDSWVDIFEPVQSYRAAGRFAFEPAMLSFTIKAAGRRKGDLISLRHFEAGIGNLRVSLQGNIDTDHNDKNAALAFSAISEDISVLGKLDGDPLPALALDLRADFTGNTSQFTLRNLAGRLGESRVAGTLDVSLQATRPAISMVANSTYLDIRPIQALLESDAGAAPADIQDRLIPAKPLPLQALAVADVTLKLNIDELRYRQDSIRNLDLEAVLQAGKLQIKQLDFEGPRGKIRSSLSIIPRDTKMADVKVDFSAEKLVLNLSGQPPENLSQVPAFDIQIHADGQGRDLRELAGSLNGSLLLGSAGGTMEGVNLRILDTFILDEIFSHFMPKAKIVDDQGLSCVAAIMKIANGKMETSPAFAFTTGRIALIAKGTLDLKTEEMQFNFNATPRNALKISAGELFNPYILVGGTLSKPTVGLDPARALLHGGAAIGTAGISILAKGFLDRVGDPATLCEEMLQKIQQYRTSG